MIGQDSCHHPYDTNLEDWSQFSLNVSENYLGKHIRIPWF